MKPVEVDVALVARVDAHRRGLIIVHIAAFIGTGIAALAMDPPVRVSSVPGRSSLTALRVLWFGWPFLLSLGVSRSCLPGKPIALWSFVIILAAVTIFGSLALDTALANHATRWGIFGITVAEAWALAMAARFLPFLTFDR